MLINRILPAPRLGGKSDSFLKAVGEFVSAWMDASAAYPAYSALSTKSNAQLAARGLRREELARSALDLPALMRE